MTYAVIKVSGKSYIVPPRTLQLSRERTEVSMLSRKLMLLLTGHPGVGKTTALMKAVESLRTRRGLKIGGMITREVREGGKRIGFQIIDVGTGKVGWLARIDVSDGPRVGKYGVNLKDLEGVGVKALLEAMEKADLVVCDEIGPMELKSAAFRQVVSKLVNCDKPVLGTVHYRLAGNLPKEVSSHENLLGN